MKKQHFNIGFINYLNDNTELDYFVRLILSMDSDYAAKVNLYIASSAQINENKADLKNKINQLNIYKDYKSAEFQEVLKTMDLGIVPSQLKLRISQSSIEFLSHNVAILCGTIGGDHELSESELFRFDDEKDFQYKIKNLMDNPELLSEYKKNYTEVTEQFIKECVEDKLIYG